MEDFIFIFPNQVKIINEIRTSQIRREDQVDNLIPETVANISGKLKSPPNKKNKKIKCLKKP